MATDDDDAATLRERVRELEQTVAQQQDTIEQLMPSRRAILAGGAGLVGGAALTGQASAQSAAGQVGTSSEPLDVEAATVSATDVNTDLVNTVELDTGRTWQDVTDSRSLGTKYTNSTDSEILVDVSISANADGTDVGVNPSVGSAILQQFRRIMDGGDRAAFNFTVPAGVTYQLDPFAGASNVGVSIWREFRP